MTRVGSISVICFVFGLGAMLGKAEAAKVHETNVRKSLIIGPLSIDMESMSAEGLIYVLKLAVDRDLIGDLWISDTVVYWLLPDEEESVIVTLRPVIDDEMGMMMGDFEDEILAAKIEGPLPPGENSLHVSVCLRNGEGYIEKFYEQIFKLNVPEMDVTVGPLRVYPYDEMEIGVWERANGSRAAKERHEDAGVLFAFLGGLAIGSMIIGLGGFFYGVKAGWFKPIVKLGDIKWRKPDIGKVMGRAKALLGRKGRKARSGGAGEEDGGSGDQSVEGTGLDARTVVDGGGSEESGKTVVMNVEEGTENPVAAGEHAGEEDDVDLANAAF